MTNKKQIDEKKKKNTTTTNKNTQKKVSSKKTSTNKKTTTNKTVKKNDNKSVKSIKKTVDDKVKNVELTNVIEKDDSRIENNKNSKKKSLKTLKKENKRYIGIGIFLVILGIISLLTCLVANRIVDREFLSDNAITFMIVASIIIEGFGSFIIINES